MATCHARRVHRQLQQRLPHMRLLCSRLRCDISYIHRTQPEKGYPKGKGDESWFIKMRQKVKDCSRLCCDISYLHRTQPEKGYPKGKGDESWFIKMRQKAKDASETIAGPKWKNLIRKFGCEKRRNAMQQFHYDSRSYALNFDSRNGRDNCEDAPGRRFTDRFARPVRECCDESIHVLPADC